MTNEPQPPLPPPPPQNPFSFELQVGAATARNKFWHDVAIERLKITTGLVTMGLRTLLLFNAGALVAIFTGLGRGAAVVTSPVLIKLASLSFILGLATAMLAVALAYRNQNENWTQESTFADWLSADLYEQLVSQRRLPMPTAPWIAKFKDIFLRKHCKEPTEADFAKFVVRRTLPPFSLALVSVLLFVIGCAMALWALSPATPPDFVTIAGTSKVTVESGKATGPNGRMTISPRDPRPKPNSH
jgi:hypothetical protein